jgi:predicted MPP superfamily phosphohydrolase
MRTLDHAPRVPTHAGSCEPHFRGQSTVSHTKIHWDRDTDAARVSCSASQILPDLQRLGIRVLRNEHVVIDAEKDGGWELASIEPDGGPDLARALAGHDPSRAVILLSHQPRAIYPAARAGVGLVLSGHTHGGQIWPFAHLVRLQQPFLEGLHRVDRTQLYVSPGTGYWGPPMRLGTRAEITRITLVSGRS